MLVDVPERTPVYFHAILNRARYCCPYLSIQALDLRRTTYLSRMIQRWGRLPLLFLETLGLKEQRYAIIGTEDWFMFPLLQPGTFIMIDETARRVTNTGWTTEFERPIYFLEHRQGYACGWCNLTNDKLILQPHPASACEPQIYSYPTDIDVIGQVSGIAMRLDQGAAAALAFLSISSRAAQISDIQLSFNLLGRRRHQASIGRQLHPSFQDGPPIFRYSGKVEFQIGFLLLQVKR